MFAAEAVDDGHGRLRLAPDTVREDGQRDQSGDSDCERKEPEHVVTLPVERAPHLRGELLEPGVVGQQKVEVEEVVGRQRRADA
jgi:hypothetical protein